MKTTGSVGKCKDWGKQPEKTQKSRGVTHWSLEQSCEWFSWASTSVQSDYSKALSTLSSDPGKFSRNLAGLRNGGSKAGFPKL